MRRTASVTSGPMPSPGMSVIVCAMPNQSSESRSASIAATGSSRARSARAKGRGLIAVDVDFTEDVAVPHDRDDDLGSGLDAARQVARIRVDVVDDDGGFFGGRGAADAAAERECACAAMVCRGMARAPARRRRGRRCPPSCSAGCRPSAAARPAAWRNQDLARRRQPSGWPSAIRRDPCQSFFDLPEDEGQSAQQWHELQRGGQAVQSAELDAARVGFRQ